MQTVDVIFKKPFNAIPTIVCTLKSGSNITTYGDLTAFVDYGSVTKKGFTIKVSNSCATLGAKPCVSWIATVLWNSNRFKIRSYIIDNTTAFKITKVVKWENSNDHMVALLLADVNRYADIYIIGRLSGVNILSKTSNVDTPQIDSSSSTLTVTLGAWSSALLICFKSVTIS